MQKRNEQCACGSGIKHKKCCGRFSIHELCSKLAEFASGSRRKDRMIELALETLAVASGVQGTFLCLVNPKPTPDGLIDWTVVGVDLPKDEQEAVVTRRVLAGYLPLGCVQKGTKWRAVINKNVVPEEVQAEYVAFARMQLNVVAMTMDGKMDKYDSELLPVQWSDRSYPGQPVKPRRPGTIRIEANLEARTVRVVVEPLQSYLDSPIDDDMVTDNPVEDALFVAEHAIVALEQIGSPRGAVPGDVFEVYLTQTDGASKLLARRECSLAPSGLRGEFALGGTA